MAHDERVEDPGTVNDNEPAPTGPAPEETQDRPGVGVPIAEAPPRPEPGTRMAPGRRALVIAGSSLLGASIVALVGGFAGAPVLATAGIAGVAAGIASLALCHKMFVGVSRESNRVHAGFESTLRKVAEPRRTISFDSLLAFAEDPELGEISQLVHEALTSTHQHRLEAGWLRREMDTLASSKAREQTEALRKEATTDALTSLVNRRGFEETFSSLFVRAKRTRTEMALLAIDLDKFKHLNDTHGHAKGDEALIAAGEVLLAQTRHSDVAARIGGDELFLVLFDTDRKEAGSVAQRLAASFAEHPKAKTLGEDWPTMSIGVALAHQDKAHDERELFRLADEALYASKRSGRSRATMYADMQADGSSKAA